MTEIPEHLLKRAQARRAAMEGGAAASDDAAPAADAPAAAGSAPVAAAKAPAKKGAAPLPTLDDDAAAAPPDIPVVAAAKNRKRVPFWAASVLAMLPLWGFIYVYSVQPPPAGDNDPLAIGAEAYVAESCSGCHLANGAGATAGGTGQQLNDDHVNLTFADPLDMVHWIAYGAAEGAREDGTYGDLDREGGPMNTGTLSGVMSPFPDIDPEEMAALVIYIREGLSGGDPEADPNFNAAAFEEDPGKLAEMVEAVIALGPGGDPDIASIEGAETE